MYYQVTVKIEFEQDNGKTKTSKEDYLVDANGVTEAEEIVNKDFEGEMITYEVTKVQKSRIIKVIENNE